MHTDENELRRENLRLGAMILAGIGVASFMFGFIVAIPWPIPIALKIAPFVIGIFALILAGFTANVLRIDIRDARSGVPIGNADAE